MLVFRGKVFSLLPLSLMWVVGFLYMVIIMLRYFLPFLVCWTFFFLSWKGVEYCEMFFLHQLRWIFSLFFLANLAEIFSMLLIFSKNKLSFTDLCPLLFFFFFYRGPISEKAMAPHSSTLPWKVPWMEEPGGPQSMGSRRVGHDWVASLSLFTFMHWRRKWQPTPVFLPGESRGRGSLVGCRLWVTQSRTRLKWLSSITILCYFFFFQMQICDLFFSF